MNDKGSKMEIADEKEFYELVCEKEFLDNLYGFAYVRCNSHYDAEDLCSDIIFAIIRSFKRNPNVSNFHAFAWSIARRVYADFSEKRRKQSEMMIIEEFSDDIIIANTNISEEFFEDEFDREQLLEIKREIAFLSKIYRDVMIMYYLDEMKTTQIGKVLNISENTVKQRLFSARQTIKKEVNKVDKKEKLLKPYILGMPGTGDLRYGDPRDQAKRLLSQNVLISCRNEAKTAKKLALEFNVPTIFMENELEILSGDLLTDVGNGKYIANFIIIDAKLQNIINQMLLNISKEFANEISEYLCSKKNDIMSVSFLEQPKSFEFVLWSMISRFADIVCDTISEEIRKKMTEAGTQKEIRHFYIIGEVYESWKEVNTHFYSQNGTFAENYMGYRKVDLKNLIGERLPWECNRFGATVSLDFNKELGMIIRTIGGLNVDTLTEDQKEIAAKSIEKGYIKKSGNVLVPNVVVMNSDAEKKYNQIFFDAYPITDKYAEKLLKQYIDFVQKFVPKHLQSQASIFIDLTSNPMRHYLIEGCIENKLLYIPTSEKCSEGIWVVVSK